MAPGPVLFRADRGLVDVRAVLREYDEYRGLSVNPEVVNIVDIDTLFDQFLLWSKAGMLLHYQMRGRMLQDTSEGDQLCLVGFQEGLPRPSATIGREVEEARQVSKVDLCELGERNGQIEKLSLKV